jgi:hypothetical protein
MSSNYLTADNGVSSGVTGITQSAGSDGTLQIRTTTSGGTATTALTIDNLQNVGVGTSSPNRKLEIQTNTLGIRLNNTTAGGNAGIEMLTGASNYSWIIGAQYNISGLEFTRSTAVGGTTYSTPSMTLDTSGRLLNICTNNSEVAFSTQHSGTSPQGIQVTYTSASPNNSGTGNTFLYCVDSSAVRAYISGNGGLNNYSANNTNLSDATMKKDITPAKSYLSILNQIPVVTFLLNDQTDTDLNLGVTAQSVQAVAPELVGTMDVGTKETPNVKLAIYETDLKYAMLKAIQELSAQVTTLQNKIGA